MKYNGFDSLLGTSHKSDLSDAWDDRYLTSMMYLRPFETMVDGIVRNVCANAKQNGCADPCLNTSGHGSMAPVQQVRKARTMMYWKDRVGFLSILEGNIRKHVAKAHRLGRKPVVRLNGTSDIPWELGQTIISHPSVQFYDYTKSAKRMVRYLEGKMPANYHLTFSRGAGNDAEAAEILRLGGNVAMVFRHHIPSFYTVEGVEYPVIDGTKHDLRFLDPQGVIVGLTALAKAKKDYSGFVLEGEEN